MSHALFATTILGVALAFAALMIGQMFALLIRRHRVERSVPLLRARETLLTRELMAIAAGRLEPENAAAFRDASTDSILEALSHLLQLVRGRDRARLLDIGERAGVLDQPIALLSHSSPSRRVDAMRLLEQFALPRSVAALEVALASDPVHAVRLEAATTLARMGSVPAPSRLVAALDMRTRPATRLHAALFRKAAAGHILELAELGGDESLQTIRPLIVESMGSCADLAHAGLLVPFAADQNPEVRCAALRAARRIGNPAASSWVTRLLLDADENVRIQAIQTCRALGARDAIPILASLLRNSSWWVRTRAQEALEDLRARQPLRESARVGVQ